MEELGQGSALWVELVPPFASIVRLGRQPWVLQESPLSAAPAPSMWVFSLLSEYQVPMLVITSMFEEELAWPLPTTPLLDLDNICVEFFFSPLYR